MTLTLVSLPAHCNFSRVILDNLNTCSLHLLLLYNLCAMSCVVMGYMLHFFTLKWYSVACEEDVGRTSERHGLLGGNTML